MPKDRAPEGEMALNVASKAADTSNPQIAAQTTCDIVKLAIPQQKYWLKKKTVREKNAGTLITTVIGAGGSIATAILANNLEVDPSSLQADATVPTVTGAVTAGATAVGGVISAFVVGAGNDGEIELYDLYAGQIDTKLSELAGACGGAIGAVSGGPSGPGGPGSPGSPDGPTANCKLKADSVRQFCIAVTGKLRWKVDLD
ncbi:hypothetical protein [Polyangium aurulentum]|uniref:hypothetical protein n=1 Tax=Polyangium aurulentum TaxID=2567896 RepID=UPI001469DCA0|nr:hypothetical protein [Polyangium aurulentum]UQA57052.1 hypothetical protein E8A73_038040 [Polyangium aurulentum]